MQFQADVLGTRVVRPLVTETTALGAAYLAGLAVGYWSSLEEIRRYWQAEATFDAQAAREEEKAGWADAVKRALSGKEKTK